MITINILRAYSVQRGVGENVKHFWIFVANKRSNKSINNNFEYNGVKYSGENAPQAYAEYFASVYGQDSKYQVSAVNEENCLPLLNISEIKISEVEFALKKTL